MEPQYVFRKGVGWVVPNYESNTIIIREYTILLEHRRPEIGEYFYYFPFGSYNKSIETLPQQLSVFNEPTFNAALYKDTAECRNSYRMSDPETDFITLTITRT